MGGFIGLLPAGGVTWDYLQYPLGFALLGHDVYYVEDTRLFPLYQKPGSDWTDCSDCVAHLRNVMECFGFKGRWAYRDEASGNVFGLSQKKLNSICQTADVFVNVSCSTVMREEYARIPVRMLIDSDPMFTQIQYATQQSFTPGVSTLRTSIEAHNHHFTFGENMNGDDCRIPRFDIAWKSTRQPVCLPYWKPAVSFSEPPTFTTLMNWTAGRVLRYDNEEWGQKDREFQKVLSLPQLLPQLKFSTVVNGTGSVESCFSRQVIEEHGWEVLTAETNAGDWAAYQRFISNSYAEFSVAKHTYVKAVSGWFSCRSACYLAAGKPVVTQDTGWSKYLPSGRGLFAYTDLVSANEALLNVSKDYRQHCVAAREIAIDFFDSNKVLSQLLSVSLQAKSLEAKSGETWE